MEALQPVPLLPPLDKEEHGILSDTLGVLAGLKEWSRDYSFVRHTHVNEVGEEKLCQNFACDLWWWHDPEVKRAIPARFIEWVGHDMERAMAALHISAHEKLNLLTGIVIKIPLIQKKIRIVTVLRRVVQMIALIGSGLIFRYFETIVSLFTGYF